MFSCRGLSSAGLCPIRCLGVTGNMSVVVYHSGVRLSKRRARPPPADLWTMPGTLPGISDIFALENWSWISLSGLYRFSYLLMRREAGVTWAHGGVIFRLLAYSRWLRNKRKSRREEGVLCGMVCSLCSLCSNYHLWLGLSCLAIMLTRGRRQYAQIAHWCIINALTIAPISFIIGAEVVYIQGHGE